MNILYYVFGNNKWVFGNNKWYQLGIDKNNKQYSDDEYDVLNQVFYTLNFSV